jgi:threonine synthase
MQYISLNKQSPSVSFREALFQGLAPDKGLYFPSEIPTMPTGFWNGLQDKDPLDIGCALLHPFVKGDLSEAQLRSILQEVLHFELPVKQISDQLHVLELFHGPTMAFKDVGALFMARCLAALTPDPDTRLTILVATSGDTGGAVANGFLGVEGVEVVILYPSGKVSALQEQQLTTLGQNITALEVNGSFDDCQRMVKKAFLDEEITASRLLSSANSINVGRWLPQMLYYVLAMAQFQKKYSRVEAEKLVFSVPSGNYGNICAGMLAHRMGMPAAHFLAATNANDVVPRYLSGEEYTPKPSVQTYSNAMDVGDPSNFIRIEELWGYQREKLSAKLSSSAYSDAETLSAMKELHEEYDYLADPHGAIGFLGARDFLKENPDAQAIFLETAHAVKFLPVVEKALGFQPELSPALKELMERSKDSTIISSYDELKALLLA